MKTLSEKIEIMQAALRGEKIAMKYNTGNCQWHINDNPIFDAWDEYDYDLASKVMPQEKRKVVKEFPVYRDGDILVFRNEKGRELSLIVALNYANFRGYKFADGRRDVRPWTWGHDGEIQHAVAVLLEVEE